MPKPARRQRWDLSTDTVVENFNAFITTMRLSGKRPLVEIVPESRSLDQNSMVYALYQQIGQQCEDKSIAEIKRECKLDYGIPMLCAESEEFCRFYDKGLASLTREEQLEAMKFVPVTSLMSKKQCTAYIDEIIREFSKQGYSLTNPSEEQAYA